MHRYMPVRKVRGPQFFSKKFPLDSSNFIPSLTKQICLVSRTFWTFRISKGLENAISRNPLQFFQSIYLQVVPKPFIVVGLKPLPKPSKVSQKVVPFPPGQLCGDKLRSGLKSTNLLQETSLEAYNKNDKRLEIPQCSKEHVQNLPLSVTRVGILRGTEVRPTSILMSIRKYTFKHYLQDKF